MVELVVTAVEGKNGGTGMGGERMSLGLGVREVDLRSEQSWAGPEACMEAVGGGTLPLPPVASAPGRANN